ncbi:phage BR0599 family protein [Candidatus Pacearchaeota archaeon]|jgi:uncharacterized phage protein (TIGR02218 family)|nr:phage BR0599 family protein [Candidatus Pacearchaeota archaeon]
MLPVELTTIVIGLSTWRIHNAVDETIVVGVNTFYPLAAMSHDAITDGTEPLAIRMPASHAIPQLYKTIAPSDKASLLIQWLDTEDNPASLRVRYKGWIKSVKFSDDGQIAEFMVESVVTSFEYSLCSDVYCTQCQVELFGTQCGLNREDHKFEGTVSEVSGNEITVPGLFADKGDQWAVPGTVKFGDDWRQVYKQEGDVLTLSVPFYEDVDGEDVVVYAGCNHTPNVCHGTFDNIVNFRGFPYIPTRNIFLTGLQ